MNETTSAVTPTVGEAVRAIADVCDWAQTRDGQGFNGQDTMFGHRLASIPDGVWTPEMRWEAHRMLRKYSGQLRHQGIEYTAIEVPETPPGYGNAITNTDVITRTARATARQMGRLSPRKASDGTISAPGSVSLTGGQFCVAFPYSDTLVVALKAAVPYQDRHWDSDKRLWTVGASSAWSLRGFIVANQDMFEVEESAQTALDAAPEPDVIPSSAAVRIEGASIIVRFDYNAALVSSLRNLQCDSRWDSGLKAHVAPLRSAARIVAWADDAGLSVDETVRVQAVTQEALVAIEAEARDGMIVASRAQDAQIDIATPSGLALRPFQKAGVIYAETARRTFIGDEPGLGKTIEVLMTLSHANAFPAVVVAPANARLVWLREAGKWLPERTVASVSGTSAHPVEANLVILNYDVLPDWLPFLPAHLAAVVLDESHRVKNHLQKDVNGTKTYKTQRVKASYELSQRVPSDGFILLVTGTPVVNRPIELASQLDIMRRLDEFGGFMGFAKRYCGAYHDAYGWDFGGATNLDELNEMLRSRCYIRRLKADVLSELPPKVWADVIIDEFDPGAMAEYRTAEADTIAYLGARAAQIAAENGLDPESAKVEALLRAESAEHLVRITALCKLAARAKMPAVRAWVEDFLESGQKLVVFAHHREIVDALATQFGADKIQGGISDTARQAAADRFQNDPQCRIIVCSIKAGGESITLTSASNVLFVEQTWTPAEMDQASDRCHRMGQRDSVTAWNAIGSGTIDEDRAQLIASKRVVVSAATEGGKAATQKHSSEADLIVKLAKRGLQAAAAA